ncbi:PLP-dependent transferase [Thozetella sp. PMI_491]|nr:PLP-dependent transferase [Thozetella sp. PMI_491]
MISKIAPEMEHINLQGGWPTPRLHPIKAMQAASAEVFSSANIPELLKYGPEWGDASLRENIGKWLLDVYQPSAGTIGAERIIVTNGASNGLATILQKFTDPAETQAIWMVEPTYFLACPVFRDAGFVGRIRAVPEGSDGVDLDYLAQALEEISDESRSTSTIIAPKTPELGYPKTYRHILYMVPTFSNPSGKTMSLRRREQLIQLARKYDVLVVTDDVYDVLRWRSGKERDEAEPNPFPPPRLVDVDRTMGGQSKFGNAVSNGSFSKIVAPGTRVGWIEGTPAFVAAMGTVGATVSGGCQGHFASLMVNEMLKSGAVVRHLNELLIPTYRQRCLAMKDAIRKHLYPYGVRILGEREDLNAREDGAVVQYDGGFFLYIIFPDDGSLPSGREIARKALDDFNLRIAYGDLFAVPDDPITDKSRSQLYTHGARLCWAWHEEEALIEGIERLAEVLMILQQGTQSK